MTPRQRRIAGALVTTVGLVAGATVGAWQIWQRATTHGAALIPMGQHDNATVTGVWSGASYAYVVTPTDPAAGGIVLIDAGSDPGATALTAELARQGHGPNDVRAILLTHGHVDHWAGTAAFPEAIVYGHRADGLLSRGAALPRALGARWLARFTDHGPGPAPQPLLPGAQVNVAGLAFEAISVPGHTPGSLAYRLGDVLFVGDSLRWHDDALTLWSFLFSDSPGDNRRALSRLLATPFTDLADGHGGHVANARPHLEALLADAATPPTH